MNHSSHNLPPFQLRPNKFVDRMLFLDLMTRVSGLRGTQNYVYISMGAKFLHDHHSVYRKIGIDSLVSFDRDSDDIKRQLFNRPIDKMKCIELDSADLPGQLDELRGKKNAIVWLDFTKPNERRVQLQQSEETIRRLEPGDVLRVTFNADYRSFGKFNDIEKTRYASLQEMAGAKLSEQIPEYLPAKLRTLKQSEVPSVLADALGMAAERTLKHRQDIRVVPILSTTYADNARMATAACVIRPANEKILPECLKGWKFRSKKWSDVLDINVPDLSMREKQHIDRRINSSPARILSSLPFKPHDIEAAEELKQAIGNYKLFHRYYPAFHHIDF